MNTILNLLGSLALCVAPTLLIIGSLKKESDPGKIEPNPATFLIRSVVAWINLATYFVGSQTTIIRTSVLWVSCISLSLIFILTLFLGRWKMVRTIEIICLCLAVALLQVWHQSTPVVANLLLQVVLVISFIPSAIRMYQLKEKQTSPPWIFATVAYVLMTTALFVDPRGYKLFQLVNPIIPGIGGNLTLAILALRQERLRKKTSMVSKAP